MLRQLTHRLLFIFAVTLSLYLHSISLAQAAPNPGGPLGLGFVLGDPAGLTIRLELNQQNAIQLHGGFDLESFDKTQVRLVLDYLFYITNMFKSTRPLGHLSPYTGLGGTVQLRELESDLRLGIRAPGGLSFRFAKISLELFIEVALGVHLLPKTATLIDGGLGIRWYF